MSPRRLLVAALAALLLPAAVGCSLLPEAGAVHRSTPPTGTPDQEAPYFDPPGPAPGSSRADIVRGFLLAMQANPVSTATARDFLTQQAVQTWKPDNATVVYGAATVQPAKDSVLTRLTDAHTLDSRGSWAPGPTHTRALRLHLVRQRGQWRIDNPVNALLLRSSYFQSQYALYNLYFYDQADKVLVPDPVYVARGQQTATSLVRGLLAGPDSRLEGVAHSAFPASTALDFSVAVTDNGVAEVPLGQDVLKLTPNELDMAMIQLAWTLEPVAGIRRVRITVGGTPDALPGGRTDVGVADGSEFAPTGFGASDELIGVSDGRVVTIAGTTESSVAGPLGHHRYAVRSAALDRSGNSIAAVSKDGRSAYVGSIGGGNAVRKVYGSGQDLLRPSFDLYGDLWLVDRTPRGAVVHVIGPSGGAGRVVRLPGVSGRQVSSFAVSPDGTRLVAGLEEGAGPHVLVEAIRRARSGRVLRGGRAVSLPLASYDPSHELGPVVDVGWRSPTLVAALTRPDGQTSRVVYAMADGSPGDGDPGDPDPYPGPATNVVVNADSSLPLMLLDAKGRLFRLDGAGKWDATGATKLTGAGYPD